MTFKLDDINLIASSPKVALVVGKSSLSSIINLSRIYVRKFYLLLYSVFIDYMPVITVALYSGRTQREKDRLAEAITDNVVNILKVERNDVVIVFQDTPHGNWYASGIRL
jgi:4-oxalocrotonate tautomerase